MASEKAAAASVPAAAASTASDKKADPDLLTDKDLSDLLHTSNAPEYARPSTDRFLCALCNTHKRSTVPFMAGRFACKTCTDNLMRKLAELAKA